MNSTSGLVALLLTYLYSHTFFSFFYTLVALYMYSLPQASLKIETRQFTGSVSYSLQGRRVY